MIGPIYADRADAGQKLAAELADYTGRGDLLVLGLPRGGVVVAYEVARQLKAPLDVVIVRKLGLPGQPELAMGAIASGGVRELNADVVAALHIPDEIIEAVAERELAELRRREWQYRGDRPAAEYAGRCVMLIDDGLATGATMRAGIAAVRRAAPARIVVAVPVAPPETVRELGLLVEQVVCPATPAPFDGISQWYGDFTQTPDEEVSRLLERARQGYPPGPP